MNGGNILAGTDGDGVWRRPLSEMIDTASVHPQREILNHVRFKTGTISHAGAMVAIEYAVPRSGQVAINIYDMTGTGITSLVNQQLDAGSYRYLWDTHSFARGCYVVRILAGGTAFMNLVRIVH